MEADDVEALLDTVQRVAVVTGAAAAVVDIPMRSMRQVVHELRSS